MKNKKELNNQDEEEMMCECCSHDMDDSMSHQSHDMEYNNMCDGNCDNCMCNNRMNWAHNSCVYTCGDCGRCCPKFWFWAIIRILIVVAIIVGAFCLGKYYGKIDDRMNSNSSWSKERMMRGGMYDQSYDDQMYFNNSYLPIQ